METLSYLAGFTMSLSFSFVPKLKEWFGALAGNEKRLVLLVFLLASAIGLYLYEFGLVYDPVGARLWLDRFIAAGLASQAAYLLTPKTNPE